MNYKGALLTPSAPPDYEIVSRNTPDVR